MDMNNDKIMEAIIDLCLRINESAVFIYDKFADTCSDNEIKTFWKKMAGEMFLRLEYWKKLKGLAEISSIPILFQDPLLINKELKENLSNINDILEKGLTGIERSQQYIIAFRLEFFMLHRAFSAFCNFTNNIFFNEITPDVDYEEHLNSFIETLKRHGHLSPELELVGMTIRRLWEEIRWLTIENTHDSITGILNKVGFFQIITPMVYLAQRNANIVGFIVLDIDEFKKVNDLHGHQAGDKVLESVAQIIKSVVRKHDIVGRYGGDELLVFLPSVEKGLTKSIAGRICRNIANESAKAIPVTASIGYNEDIIDDNVEEKIREYIKKADNFMYEAKKEGKNCVVGNR